MKICSSCNEEFKTEQAETRSYPVTMGICGRCRNKLSVMSDAGSIEAILDSIEGAVLLMQPDPRQVYAANRKAVELFGKKTSAMEGRRGGEVFECVHSFTQAGCGKDRNCENCRIKNSIVETLTTGKSFQGVSTSLGIRMRGTEISYEVAVSTERAGDLALVRIDRFQRGE